MKKNITKLALVSLALLSLTFSFAIPYVRVLFNEQTNEVYYGQPFTFTIAFTNVNELWVYADDEYHNERVPLDELSKNRPWEIMLDYGDVIYEYDYYKEYTITVYDENGYMDIASITYHTQPSIEIK